MNRQAVTAVVAVLALAGAVLLFLRHRAPDLDRKATAMHSRGGEVLAELARRECGGTGRVLLIEPDPALAGDADKQNWLVRQSDAFAKALGGGLTLAGRESITLLLSRQVMPSNRPAAFTLRSYQDLVRRHADATLVVSLAGAPQPDRSDSPAALQGLPPLLCLSQTGKHVPALMKLGLLKAAIVPRAEPAPPGAFDGDWFDIMYETVTPANVDTWAQAAGMK